MLLRAASVAAASAVLLLFVLAAEAAPMPQSLTEDQFSRSFPDEEVPNNDVKIVSGYSRVRLRNELFYTRHFSKKIPLKVSRYGRGFANTPLKSFGPLTVKSPFDLNPRNRLGGTRDKQTYDDDRAPVFDLQKMLREQELKARIAAANSQEEARAKVESEAEEEAEEAVREVVEEAMKEVEKEIEEKIDEAIDRKVEEAFDETLNKIMDEAIKEEQKMAGEIRKLEEELAEAAENVTEVDILVVEDGDEDAVGTEGSALTEEDGKSADQPPMEIDLGSVEEVRVAI